MLSESLKEVPSPFHKKMSSHFEEKKKSLLQRNTGQDFDYYTQRICGRGRRGHEVSRREGRGSRGFPGLDGWRQMIGCGEEHKGKQNLTTVDVNQRRLSLECMI